MNALIVGIDHYEFGELKGCVNDAKKIHDLLSINDDGSPNFSSKLLVSSHKASPISKSELINGYQQLLNSQTDLALFYFSGHGYIDELGGYLVTPDAKNHDAGIRMTDLIQLANKAIHIHEIVIILDCCHAGLLGQSNVQSEASNIRTGVSILAACRSFEQALEVNGVGKFTRLLVQGLSGKAKDVLGDVHIASIYHYMDRMLGWWDQRPILKTNVIRLRPLRQCVPKVDLSLLRMLPTVFETPESLFPLGPEFEPDCEPSDSEKEQLFNKLQKLNKIGLVSPIGASRPFMYFAAIESKSCQLTMEGQIYWNLASRNKI